MDVSNFRVEIVRPALQLCGLWSESAENLLIGTALAESNLSVVSQMSGGPGLSFFQIEPKSYDDVVKYLYRPDNVKLKDRILAACLMEIFPEAKCLAWNIRLAVLMARVIYWRYPTPLPRPDDLEGLARTWKTQYNTIKGAGTIEHFIKAWSARIK